MIISVIMDITILLKFRTRLDERKLNECEAKKNKIKEKITPCLKCKIEEKKSEIKWNQRIW